MEGEEGGGREGGRDDREGRKEGGREGGGREGGRDDREGEREGGESITTEEEETLPLEVECRVILSHRSVCVLITVILKCSSVLPLPLCHHCPLSGLHVIWKVRRLQL